MRRTSRPFQRWRFFFGGRTVNDGGHSCGWAGLVKPRPACFLGRAPLAGSGGTMGSNPPSADLATPQPRFGDAGLRLTIEEAGLSTWETDLVTQEAIWSPNHYRLFGYPVDPTGRATLDMWASRLHPDDRQR